ncbi:MAG: ATP-binding protein [Ktedonobacteraceae bacterium]
MLSTQFQGRLRAFLQRLVTWHANSVAQLPRWRHPLLGYLLGLLLVGLALAVGVVEIQLLSPFAFPGVLLFFAVVLVALFWGVGSAVFTILLSLLALDYLYVPPFGTLGDYSWRGMLQLLTFASTGIIIALLTKQREAARVRALAAEHEALLRANQLSATFEAINDGVVVYSKQGQVLQTNAATRRLFGLKALPSKDEAYLRQELLLQGVQQDEQGKILPEKRRPLSRLLAGGVLAGTQAPDVLVQIPDGRKIVLNMSGALIRGETGTTERAVLIYRDVTERRRLEQRSSEALAAMILDRARLQREHAEARASALALQEANRRMEEFLGIICHELKNPLTVMRGSLQLAERKVKQLVSSEALLPDELRRFAPIQALLERARSQVGIQDRLVNDLLDASRIRTQALQLLMTPCNLVSIVQEAVDDQRQIVPARSIHMEMPEGKDVPVSADADRLVQVVTNYLTNALKYSTADRPVAVRLHVHGHTAHVSVRDEGPGLPASEHKRVWECFYCVPGIEVQSKSEVGLGVGLYVCRTIIEQHGGQVGVDSKLGEGSTFWFTLPLTQPAKRDEETVY